MGAIPQSYFSFPRGIRRYLLVFQQLRCPINCNDRIARIFPIDIHEAAPANKMTKPRDLEIGCLGNIGKLGLRKCVPGDDRIIIGHVIANVQDTLVFGEQLLTCNVEL